MKTTGYHTVKFYGTLKEIKDHGPYKSKDKTAFLGSGYYFWDDNLARARYWGSKHYNGKYVICTAKLDIDDDDLLDLASNCSNINLFVSFLHLFKKEHNCNKCYVNDVINYMKTVVNKKQPGSFPFKAIKAKELNNHSNKTISFTERTPKAVMSFNPIIIICLIDNENDLYSEYKIHEYKK